MLERKSAGEQTWNCLFSDASNSNGRRHPFLCQERVAPLASTILMVSFNRDLYGSTLPADSSP